VRYEDALPREHPQPQVHGIPYEASITNFRPKVPHRIPINMKDNLYTGAESRTRLVRGIKKAADAVGSTMGTRGSNALIQVIENPQHMATNDGATILQSIHFADPLEEMGKNILVESVSRANKQSGDGSSTTTVLTAAIIEEGMKSTENAIDIKRSLEECLPIVEEQIKAQSKEITVDTVAQVATISAEDEEIGNRIQDIYQQIGKDGIVYWDVSKTTEDSYSIGTGINIHDAGFLSPYMCDANDAGQNTNQIRLKNPHILVTKQKITSALDFEKIGAELFAKTITDLVVFADEVEPLVVPDLIKTRMMKGFRFIIVKMPTIWKDQWFEDIALATGASLVDPSAGLPMREVKMEHLGTVGDIIITKTDTYIDGIKDLSEHVQKLTDEATEEATHRASRLNTKTARYFVGAPSESALSYRRLKVEDAISAAYQALHGGIVPGAGNAMACVVLPDTIGGRILETALLKPMLQIMDNAGITIKTEPAKGKGYDTRTRELVDLIEAGIVNPTNVEINAVRNAISVAATLLSAPTVVTLPQHDEAI
jgi:chaperonin GroEL